MKTLQIIKSLTFIIIGGIFVFIFFRAESKLNAYMDNTEQLLSNNKDQIIQLTKRDFRDVLRRSNDSLLNHIKDSFNIKDRHIYRTVDHNYKHSYDTTITILNKTELPDVFYFDQMFNDSCLFISGNINLIDSVITFDEVNIDYSAKTVYYFKRKKLLGFIPLGRKQFYIVTDNKCTGMNEVREISIIKRK
jgi:hypothetical protein